MFIIFIILTGLYKNNGFCWYTTMVNNMIDPTKPMKKWRSRPSHFIKQYLRGHSWAYSNIVNNLSDIDELILTVFPLIKGIQLMITNKK